MGKNHSGTVSCKGEKSVSNGGWKLMDEIVVSADILDKDSNNKKEEKKLEETRSKSKSWQSKYNWQIQKSKE